MVIPVLFLSILLFCYPAFAVNTTAPPLSLRWYNITLDDGIGFNRGIYVLLGNPGQPLGLRATTLYVNTRIRNARDCAYGNETTATGCDGASGSSFDMENSRTHQKAPPGEWKVGAIDPHDSTEIITQGYDTAKFNNIPEIVDFPIEVWSKLKATNKSALALGPKSSFIQKLVDTGRVPSHVFGLFFGSRSQIRGMDGLLTIGGYSKARVAEKVWTNFSINAEYRSSPCPLQILLQDMRITFSNGTSHSLFTDAAARIPACIDPLQNQFTFTKAMSNRFSELTEHEFNVTGEPPFNIQTYPISKEHLMENLTIVLSNGYKTVIPHYELVSQFRGTNEEGKYSVLNESRIMVAAAPDEKDTGDGNILPVLGGVYLSQNYLLVDYKRGTFSMAPARIDDVKEGQEDIETVIDPDTEDGEGPSSDGRLRVGEIGGIVAGVILVAVVAVAVYLYFRKSEEEAQNDPQNSDKMVVEKASDGQQNGGSSLTERNRGQTGAGQSDPRVISDDHDRQDNEMTQAVSSELPTGGFDLRGSNICPMDARQSGSESVRGGDDRKGSDKVPVSNEGLNWQRGCSSAKGNISPVDAGQSDPVLDLGGDERRGSDLIPVTQEVLNG